MPAAKSKTKLPTKTAVTKYLTDLLDNEMSQGDRAAIVRTIHILKGDR